MALDKITMHQTSLEQFFLALSVGYSRFLLITAHLCGSLYRRHYTDCHHDDNKLLSKFYFNHPLNLLPDLTTYDTVKHLLLGHTSLQDNWVTHTISR